MRPCREALQHEALNMAAICREALQHEALNMAAICREALQGGPAGRPCSIRSA